MAYIGRDVDKISNVEVLDNITFDGSSSYTLQKNSVNFTPSSANTLLVSIDGVVQAGNFTVSGSTIDFGTAVAGTSTCDFILHYGVGLITTPADGTVSLDKLSASGTKDATTFLRGDNTFAAAGSPSITDNGNANAITIDSNERVQFTRPRSNTLGDSALEILPSDTVAGIGFRMENTNNDLVIEKSSPSGSEAEILRIRIGGGIALGGTGDANTLDDYEEGSWSVDFRRSGSSIGSFNNRSAYYTKIGNVVYVTASAQYTGSSLTGAYITGDGLPFTISNQNNTSVAGTYKLGPGSGSTAQSVGSAGGWNEQDDFFMTPGGEGGDIYLNKWQQNYYMNVAFWYYTDA
jgi:hypothetical protein